MSLRVDLLCAYQLLCERQCISALNEKLPPSHDSTWAEIGLSFMQYMEKVSLFICELISTYSSYFNSLINTHFLHLFTVETPNQIGAGKPGNPCVMLPPRTPKPCQNDFIQPNISNYGTNILEKLATSPLQQTHLSKLFIANVTRQSSHRLKQRHGHTMILRGEL